MPATTTHTAPEALSVEREVLADPRLPDFRELSTRVGPVEANRLTQLHYKRHPAPRAPAGFVGTGVCWSGMQ